MYPSLIFSSSQALLLSLALFFLFQIVVTEKYNYSGFQQNVLNLPLVMCKRHFHVIVTRFHFYKMKFSIVTHGGKFVNIRNDDILF